MVLILYVVLCVCGCRGAWLELMVVFSSTLAVRRRECFPLALTAWPPVLLGTLLAFGIPTLELWYAALQLGLCCITDGLPLWISSLNFQVPFLPFCNRCKSHRRSPFAPEPPVACDL